MEKKKRKKKEKIKTGKKGGMQKIKYGKAEMIKKYTGKRKNE